MMLGLLLACCLGLPAEVPVDTDTVTLGVILQLPADDPRAAIPMGSAPNPGETRRFLKQEITAHLAAAGFGQSGLEFPESVVVRRIERSPSSESATSAILAAVVRQYPEGAVDVISVEVPSTPALSNSSVTGTVPARIDPSTERSLPELSGDGVSRSVVIRLTVSVETVNRPAAIAHPDFLNTLRGKPNVIQGDARQTNNQLDLEIEGNGFFQVRTVPGEIAYTRDGSFHLNSEGQVVTADGTTLVPQITIPVDANMIVIGKDGTVTVTKGGQNTPQAIGRIELASFRNPAGLNATRGKLFTASDSSGGPIVGNPGENGMGRINQGFLEQTDVGVVGDMVSKIVEQLLQSQLQAGSQSR